MMRYTNSCNAQQGVVQIPINATQKSNSSSMLQKLLNKVQMYTEKLRYLQQLPPVGKNLWGRACDKSSYLSAVFDVILFWLLTGHKNWSSSFSSQKIVTLFQGKMQMSVWYGHCHPNYFLLHLKLNIATKFKEPFPECNFSTSTLIHEFPPYAVQPISWDLECKTCPIHVNTRRLIKAINKILWKGMEQLLPFSCRQISLKVATCSTRECPSCPDLQVNVDEKLFPTEITVCQWQTKKQKLKTNKANGLKKMYLHYILKKWLWRWQLKV